MKSISGGIRERESESTTYGAGADPASQVCNQWERGDGTEDPAERPATGARECAPERGDTAWRAAHGDGYVARGLGRRAAARADG